VRAYRNSALCDANVTQVADAPVAQLARKRKTELCRARARRGVPYKNAERSGDVDVAIFIPYINIVQEHRYRAIAINKTKNSADISCRALPLARP